MSIQNNLRDLYSDQSPNNAELNTWALPILPAQAWVDKIQNVFLNYGTFDFGLGTPATSLDPAWFSEALMTAAMAAKGAGYALSMNNAYMQAFDQATVDMILYTCYSTACEFGPGNCMDYMSLDISGVNAAHWRRLSLPHICMVL